MAKILSTRLRGRCPVDRGAMHITHPLSGLFPGAVASSLEVLVRTSQPLTGRGIAALVSPPVSHATVQAALRHLVEQGLASRESVGRAHVYRFNHQHFAAPHIVTMAEGRTVFLEGLRDQVQQWSVQPSAVWLFGSVARGEDSSDSDVDILVIRPLSVEAEQPEWTAQLVALSAWVFDWTGNSCEVVELDADEFGERRARGDRLVAEVEQDALVIAGAMPRHVGPAAA